MEEALSCDQPKWLDPFIRRDMIYIAPEAILGQKQGFGIDWWSMGIIFYQMLTGLTSNPFAYLSTLQEYFAAVVNGERPGFYRSWGEAQVHIEGLIKEMIIEVTALIGVK
jgi:serine/threonine protein kinase